MPSLEKPVNRVFLGRGGEGKSTLLRHSLKQAKRVMIFDMAREEINERGATVVETKSELVDALIGQKEFRLCVRFPRNNAAAKLPMFEWMNRAALEVGNCVVVWEECNVVFKTAFPPYAEMIMHQGRHDRVRLALVARRPVYLTDPLNLATEINAFRMTGDEDIKTLSRYVGKEAAAAVQGLEPHYYVQWTEARWKICRPVKLSA